MFEGKREVRRSNGLLVAIVWANVADHLKNTAYLQAPPEFGGEWWPRYMVEPLFGHDDNDPKLWEQYPKGGAPAPAPLPPGPELPEGFAEIFGASPDWFVNDPTFLPTETRSIRGKAARTQWEAERKRFKRAGWPEWADSRQMVEANATYPKFGMGVPFPYEGRYGYTVRFPQSDLRRFEHPAWTVLNSPHLTIAQYQISAFRSGFLPEHMHPFLPHEVKRAIEEAKANPTAPAA